MAMSVETFRKLVEVLCMGADTLLDTVGQSPQDRGYVTREEGLARMERIVSFLEKADRFHGAYPHWWYGDTGKVKPFGQKDNGGDLVETAFLIQGLLAVHQYYVNGNEKEKALAQRIDQIWRDVDWNWYRQGGQNVLYWHWSPTYGWEMNFPVHG